MKKKTCETGVPADIDSKVPARQEDEEKQQEEAEELNDATTKQPSDSKEAEEHESKDEEEKEAKVKFLLGGPDKSQDNDDEEAKEMEEATNNANKSSSSAEEEEGKDAKKQHQHQRHPPPLAKAATEKAFSHTATLGLDAAGEQMRRTSSWQTELSKIQMRKKVAQLIGTFSDNKEGGGEQVNFFYKDTFAITRLNRFFFSVNRIAIKRSRRGGGP